MNDELKQIGLRLKGLRDALELTKAEFAASCDIPLEDYIEYEAGKKDFSISLLKKIATQYNVDITTLMFDEEPRMNSYAITRKEKGLAIKRVEEYQYQALATGFANRKADIFIVTVEPKADDTPIHLSKHSGQEFNLVFKGRLLLQINGKDLILEKGDSLYFDPSLPHGMKALDGKPVKFLAVIV
ncbi:helix-turn-helix domain-containing protein [Dysgonomonas sp. GY617]|uniref:helix-turn-helix domain-containing protein n=1 Tax=Dysgonomonas sp. GY617 TaxID=2780420 RepID=UPI001883EBBD|nr:XRE family transcriptional regulator [Dysgonomonas sp. GY617]MBF0575809.1 helix-turn-helix transcriptional regulator [Dysgonomonas sp. GY617]